MQAVDSPEAGQVSVVSPEETRAVYRNAMARLGAAVNIVTTDGSGGRAGFAATAVCSVSDNPPTLLVCLNKGSSAYQAVKANGAVCVNVLSSRHRDLSHLFGGKTSVEERFSGSRWHVTELGCLALDDALVTFDCRISSFLDVHTHDVLLCEVTSINERSEGKSLIYLNRNYHEL
jgi:flavin reductase